MSFKPTKLNCISCKYSHKETYNCLLNECMYEECNQYCYENLDTRCCDNCDYGDIDS